MDLGNRLRKLEAAKKTLVSRRSRVANEADYFRMADGRGQMRTSLEIHRVAAERNGNRKEPAQTRCVHHLRSVGIDCKRDGETWRAW